MSESRNPDNMDILLYAAAPYAGKNELGEFEKADESELSPKAEKRIFKKIQRRIDYYEKHEKFHPVFETLKRVAVIVLAVMSISFVSALSIEAVSYTHLCPEKPEVYGEVYVLSSGFKI